MKIYQSTPPMKHYLSHFALFFSICSLLHAAEKTYTYNFNPYGSLEVTINGHTPAEHCIDKSPNTGGKNLYLMLPHCSQRFWDPADLLKYKTTCKFTPNPGFILTSPQIVPNKYNLDKMTDKDSVALPKSKQVAGFNLKLDENHSDYEEREKKGYNNATITVVIQTPTILLTAHAPGEFGKPGMKAYRPLTEGEDTMTVDAAEKKHGYVAVLRRNDDNDDGKKYALDKDTGFAVNDDDKPRDNKDTQIPETELTPGVNSGGLKNPRPVAFDPGKRPDNDLVAIKLDLKKPEGFVFNKVNINLNIPAETNFYGADRTYRKPDYWMNGVSLDTKSDGALGDLTEKGTVTLYCEGKGKSDPSEKAGFTNGDTSLKILGGQLRETKSEVFLFYLDMLAHYQGSIKGNADLKPQIHLGESKTYIPRMTDAEHYEAFLMQNVDFDEDVANDPWLSFEKKFNNGPLTQHHSFWLGEFSGAVDNKIINKRDGITKAVSLSRDDDFMKVSLIYIGAKNLKNAFLKYEYEKQNNLETYFIDGGNTSNLTNKGADLSSRDLNQPWKNILSTSNTDLFIEDRDGSNNVGMRGVTDDQIDNKYKPRSSSIIKFGFERGAYKVYTKLSIEPAGNFNYQYKIVEGSIPTGSLTFSSGRGLVRFKNLKGEIKRRLAI